MDLVMLRTQENTTKMKWSAKIFGIYFPTELAWGNAEFESLAIEFSREK